MKLLFFLSKIYNRQPTKFFLLLMFFTGSMSRGIAQDNPTAAPSPDLQEVLWHVSLEGGNAYEKGYSEYSHKQLVGLNVGFLLRMAFGKMYHIKAETFNNIENYPDEPNPTKGLFLQGDVQFIQKGYKDENFKARFNYIELKILPGYKYGVGQGKAVGGLGPFVAYGIGGKSGTESSFGENAGGYKRLDAGIAFMLGYELNMGLGLHFNYDLGLVNTAYANLDVTSKNRGWGVDVSYNIGRLLTKK